VEREIKDATVYVKCAKCGRRIGTYYGEVPLHIYSVNPLKPANVFCHRCFREIEREKRKRGGEGESECSDQTGGR